MNQYMVDTNIFNRVLDNKLNLKVFKRDDLEFFSTHVQRDEIVQTPNDSRREELLSLFHEISESISTESALWGVSAWGKSKWARDETVSKILLELEKLKKKGNNNKDALIADTAIKNSMTLLTEDSDLFNVTRNFGGKVEKIECFLNSLNQK